MPRRRPQVANPDHRVFLSSFLANLDRVSLDDYAAKLEAATAEVAQFARDDWSAHFRKVAYLFPHL